MIKVKPMLSANKAELLKQLKSKAQVKPIKVKSRGTYESS